MSGISVSLDNPYGDVTIPRAKLRGDQSLVIGNPVALSNPYGKTEGGEAQAPSTYNVKLAEPEEEMRCRACCYRCRRRKQWWERVEELWTEEMERKGGELERDDAQSWLDQSRQLPLRRRGFWYKFKIWEKCNFLNVFTFRLSSIFVTVINGLTELEHGSIYFSSVSYILFTFFFYLCLNVKHINWWGNN